ncbi:cysteine protease ATG4B isoform 3-T3 [Amazona ochrocephala]
MDAATLTYDTLRFEYEDFPETKEPVWILGREYSVFTEKEEILLDVTSRLWFTYRKNFPAIGGTGPTSDTGWGCMLRCGQMIFAQALVCRHLGRDWRWIKGKRQMDNYFSVLNAFIDKKDSYYSIHQIAQMGVGEGKSIGQWYGPNTVAQVLKKLAAFDTWSSLAVHIAMDNTVVMEEIRRLCQSNLPCAGAAACPAVEPDVLYNGYPEEAGVRDRLSLWKPLVLLIPLRLGLTEINEAYIETLKLCVFCIAFPALLHDAPVAGSDRRETKQCSLLHWLCRAFSATQRRTLTIGASKSERFVFISPRKERRNIGYCLVSKLLHRGHVLCSIIPFG